MSLRLAICRRAFGASLMRHARATSRGVAYSGLRFTPHAAINAANDSRFLSRMCPLHFVVALLSKVTPSVPVRAALVCESILMRFSKHFPALLRLASAPSFRHHCPNRAFERDARNSAFSFPLLTGARAPQLQRYALNSRTALCVQLAMACSTS
jgi:hypothetical protein